MNLSHIQILVISDSTEVADWRV